MVCCKKAKVKYKCNGPGSLFNCIEAIQLNRLFFYVLNSKICISIILKGCAFDLKKKIFKMFLTVMMLSMTLIFASCGNDSNTDNNGTGNSASDRADDTNKTDTNAADTKNDNIGSDMKQDIDKMGDDIKDATKDTADGMKDAANGAKKAMDDAGNAMKGN